MSGQSNQRGASRRRSTSEGEGELLSSTLNLPETVTINRFSNLNTDRCVSTPQINLTGFIDDTFRNNRGTCLESRIQTRSKGGSNSANAKLRDDYTLLKISIFEWGELVCNSAQALDVIEQQYNGFLEEIQQKISEVLLTRGEFHLVGELGSLKDKLNWIRKEAKRLTRTMPDVSNSPDAPVQASEFNTGLHRGSRIRMEDQDYEFHDEPVNRDPSSDSEHTPVSRGRRNAVLSKNVRSVMVCGSGTVPSATDPTRLILQQDQLMYHTPGRSPHSRGSVVNSGAECVSTRSGPNSLNSSPVSNARGGDEDSNRSLESVLFGIQGLTNSSERGDIVDAVYDGSWRVRTDARQDTFERKLDQIRRGMSTIATTVHGAESMYRSMQEDIEALKSNSTEVWVRLRSDERRLDKLEDTVTRVEQKLDERMEMVQDWFVELTTQATPDIPKEIVDSIQEVINDNSSGSAVHRMREEIGEIRNSLDTSRHATEGLRGLVVNLSEQVANTSYQPVTLGQFSPRRDPTSEESMLREREIIRKGIERAEKQLRQIILVDSAIDSKNISLIKKLKTVDVPSVHTAVGNIQTSLQKYVKFHGMDHEYCDSINDLLDSAENWCLRIEELYNNAEVHSINTSKGDSADVGVFSDNAKVTVYEFLESAEIAYLGWGNSVQKANRLYNRHLSDEIKSKLINMSDSYTDMKKWLVMNYGGVSRIISDILSDLNRRNKPNPANNNAKYSFYAYISGALQRMERLSRVNEIDNVELVNCLYSRATLTSLSCILPSETYADWITEMTRAGLDYKNPVGLSAYSVFKNLCIIERNKSEGSRESERLVNMKSKSPKSPKSPRSKTKSVHKVLDAGGHKSEEEVSPGVFAATFHNTKWYQANLKFPCPVTNHAHEMSTCAEFFSLNPVERWSKMDKGKICYACLCPKDICVTRRCSFESRVPETLKCQGCVSWAQSKGLAPLSILFCRRKEHANLRASFQDMKKDLEKYIGKLGTTVVDSSIKFAANYTYQVFSLDPGANALGWVQENFIDKPAPSIDSETGKSLEVSPEHIVHEVLEHSCYLMQTIKIGSTESLVFFDRGANIHIIDGSLAEREGLQKVSSDPTSLTVVGGNRVKSNHGTFRFNLGPGDKGEFHEVVCVGMEDVTGGFGVYDLSEICKEYKEQMGSEADDVVLPQKVGGSRVHLLLGIKNTNLDPVLVKVLPSGVAVYLSPFKDIYGSRLIFAGPHKSFTKADGGVKTEMSNAVFLIREKVYEDFEGESESRCFSITTDRKLGLTVTPHPIGEEDIQDSHGTVPEQFEESLDDHERLLELLETLDASCIQHSGCANIKRFESISRGIELGVGSLKDSMKDFIFPGDGIYKAQAPEEAPGMMTVGNLAGSESLKDNEVECHTLNHGVYKAHVPIAKFRNALDDEDSQDKAGFRCADCAKCLTCKLSNKKTAISLREAREQEFIEQSVRIDIKQRKVLVNYPFLRNPAEYLSSVHNGSSNYSQALKVYKQQCRKPDAVKEGMRKVHEDLVEKGFMIRLADLEENKRMLIEKAPFQHFNPWRLVMKMDSMTTPVRMVVDPTMTHFNEILAKGENRIGLIFTIMIRCRCLEFIWSSDISKLYNQLFMDDHSLPYSLFLYGKELDTLRDPEIWVMVRAWYGIVSTGGQAGYALDKLTEMMSEEFPEAYTTLRENRYVDDLLSGADTESNREKQISAVEEVLKRGGFSLKFVVKSGEKPSEKASSDGESMKLLGYKWDPEKDELSPGLGELNLNKKVRGEKKPNTQPICTITDAERLLSGTLLTRSLIVGKISELFDPCGFFEPIKLQMKLLTGSLKGKDWDEILPDEDQEVWRDILKGYVDLPKIAIPRFCLPGKNESKSKIRLLCLADAAEFAGGAAVYAGKEISPGIWTCSLLAAKSKMMKETIPRNELSAILLCAELAFMVKSALGSEVGEIIYITDSTIALSWCSNESIKLRLFVYNRVMTILRLFEWTTGSKDNPLFHIDGALNLADLLTKKHDLKVKDVSKGSDWIEGLNWMKRDKSEMPLTSYKDLRVDKIIEENVKVECFPDSFMEKFSYTSDERNADLETVTDEPDDEPEFSVLAAVAGRGVAELLVDPVFQGWRRALRITGYLQGWRVKYCHKKHLIPDENCNLCKLGEHRWDPRNEEKKAEQYLFRWESKRVQSTMKPRELDRFIIQEGIVYDKGRLSPEFQFKTSDLDQVGYLDKHEILGQVPVVLPDSPVLYSFLMYIHTKSNLHASLEVTVREVHKKMKVVKGLRWLVKKIISDCLKCRLVEKKTLELRLANHPEARTVLAPCFHSCMMDICYGFKGQSFKRSRTTVKVYGLVVVCLLSGATNIMALEGIETQDVCAALERHSNRYGVPAFIYVDNGTQLKALQFAKFSVRDLEAQVQDNLGIKIVVSSAKAHSERGRVERRIRVLRETLEKLGVDVATPMTCMQWDTLFSRISNSIDNLPLARGDTSNESSLGYEIITPNRLKLGRNNYRSLEGNGIDLDMSSNFTKILDRNRSIYQQWYQSFIDNVHLLNLRPNKWLKSSRLPNVNDVVIFVFNDSNYTKESAYWRLAKVVEVQGSKVVLKYGIKANRMGQTLTRSVRDISIVYSVGEMLINTRGHFDECSNQSKDPEE